MTSVRTRTRTFQLSRPGQGPSLNLIRLSVFSLVFQLATKLLAATLKLVVCVYVRVCATIHHSWLTGTLLPLLESCCKAKGSVSDGERSQARAGEELLPSPHLLHFLLEVQHHARWVLQELLPHVGEATHGGAVDDAVVS